MDSSSKSDRKNSLTDKKPLVEQIDYGKCGKSMQIPHEINTKPVNMPELESLINTILFIIQPKVDADFFHPNLTHEIFNEKKHLLFKGIFKRKLLARRSEDQKVSILNLSKTKILAVDFQDDKLCGTCNEAVISCPPGSPRGRVTKYGGKYEAPSYEIIDFTCTKKILFSVEHSPSASSSSGSLNIDYSVMKGNRERVAQITSKSGLNFMLHIIKTISPLDKAVLLGFIIAMDMFKQGKTTRKTNEYEYN